MPTPASEAERLLVLNALRDHACNIAGAARSLGVSRVTLYRMMQRNRIELYQNRSAGTAG